MFNKLFLIIKKVIIAILMIYTYNIIVFPLGITIAFNVFTIILIGIFYSFYLIYKDNSILY